MIEIFNVGREIASTNYWDIPFGRDGYVYLAPNAGAWRLLTPQYWRDIEEITHAQGVAITRGPWAAKGVADAVEILFDDGSDSPYALHVTLAQVERLPAAEDPTERRMLVYGPGPSILLDLPCRYRLGPIPCLAPWNGK